MSPGRANRKAGTVGTVVVGLALPGSVPDAVEFRLPGDRERVRQLTTISALNTLRRRLCGQRLGAMSRFCQGFLVKAPGRDEICRMRSTNEHMFGTTVM